MLLIIAPIFMSGCVLRGLQPPQYGTQVVQQVKVLGAKISVPSTSTSQSFLELYLGYVSETVIIIPVISNVDINGNVSENKADMAASPLITAFGVSENGGVTGTGIKLNDNIISGYPNSGTNDMSAVLSMMRVGIRLRPIDTNTVNTVTNK